MRHYVRGDRVRIDIPDETHPHHDLHAEHGVVIGFIDKSWFQVGLEDIHVTFNAWPWELRSPIK